MVIGRLIDERLPTLLGQFPAVALLGPRQSGKTTVALGHEERLGERAVYVDLERPADRAKLSDPEIFFGQHAQQLVILDAIHRLPDLFQTLRGVIDRNRWAGRTANQFLLLGSASIDLMRQSSESLAGRIAYLELTPFLELEVAATGASAMNTLWLRGGFPRSFLADSNRESYEWRIAFIRTYLERDVPALGPRIPAETLRRLWQMLAHSQGQLLNAAQLAAGLGISSQTVFRYLDVLVDLLLVRRLHPWVSNVKKRLTRSPKVYVRDSGLVHALLGIRSLDDVLGHPIAGPSWEGMAVENLLGCLSQVVPATFYRTAAGAEIDLVVDAGAGEVWAIEMKRSLAKPAPKPGFYIGCEDVRATHRVVVYPGEDTFAIGRDTIVMSLAEAMRRLRASAR